MSERHSTRTVREVLRLKLEAGRSHRQIAAACRISSSTVGEYVRRAESSGLSWNDAEALSDAELDARLFRQRQCGAATKRAPLDCCWIHRQLRRTGVTLRLLWSEYLAAVRQRSDGREPYQYSQFCAHYHRWRSRLDLGMRQVHRAGEKAFIDYSRNKPAFVERAQVVSVELFVMVLGASNYTFAEATRTQQDNQVASSIVRGLEFFGGVPEILVLNQLPDAVSGQTTLFELAQHYGTAIIPARPRNPRDKVKVKVKVKVEAGVLVAQRWIVARLRHRQFRSLDELNATIAELLDDLNFRAFRKLEGCRQSAFENIDRPKLRPLPVLRFAPKGAGGRASR